MLQTQVLIIGAGISGLVAANALRRQGAEIALIEANPQVGGVVQTQTDERGFLCELGPNTFMLSKPEVAAFLERSGLLSTTIEAAPHARKRYVLGPSGRLTAVPTSILKVLTSPLLSRTALLRELFIPPSPDPNETVASFFSRRFGSKAADELVDPFVSGIFGGDPSNLLMRYSLPRIHEMEQQHGSVIKGMLSRGKSAVGRRLLGWPNGMREWMARLMQPLSEFLYYSASAEWIRRTGLHYTVGTRRGEFRAQQVILATDAHQAARLVQPLIKNAAELSKVPYVPMGVVHLGFVRGAVGHPLDGFGMLISRKRGIRTLGALFSSTLFANRAPDGHVLLTAYLGGATDYGSISLSDEALITTAYNDLAPHLGIKGEPVFSRVTRWHKAIPQYDANHPLVMQTCHSIETGCPGLHLLGSYRGGISLEDCIANALRLAERLD
jgi:protoporphyrinogen/coproporphyrinogen III oxidase